MFRKQLVRSACKYKTSLQLNLNFQMFLYVFLITKIRGIIYYSTFKIMNLHQIGTSLEIDPAVLLENLCPGATFLP
jgi:hypothetical protein